MNQRHKEERVIHSHLPKIKRVPEPLLWNQCCGSWSTAALWLIRLAWRRQFELQLPPLLFTHIKRLLGLTCTANNIRGHFVKWLSTDLGYSKLLNTAACNVKWRLLLPDDEPAVKVQDKGFFFFFPAGVCECVSVCLPRCKVRLQQ